MKEGSLSVRIAPFIFWGEFPVRGKVDAGMRTRRAPNG